MPESVDLQSRILAAMPSLSPAAKRVANVAMADPAETSGLTVTQLARRAGSSEATVVRVARALGFAGYPQLRLALAATSARDAGPGPAFAEPLADDDELPALVAKLAALETEALHTTAQTLDAAALAAVVDAITHGGRVAVYGVGASGLVACDLEQKLFRIGVDCRAHVEEHDALTSAVLLTGSDLVIAVSHSGETVAVLEPLRRAAAGGATTVAITNAPGSSLARTADHVLLAAGRESDARPGAMASRTSQLFLVDCLFVAVGRALGLPARHALEVTHEALRTPRQRADVATRPSA